MPTHWVQRTRTTQPQAPVPIDRSHPLGRHCVFAWIGPHTGGAYGIDLVSGRGPNSVVGTPAPVSGPYGPALDFAGTSDEHIAWDDNVDLGNLAYSGMTVAAAARCETANRSMYSLGPVGTNHNLTMYFASDSSMDLWNPVLSTTYLWDGLANAPLNTWFQHSWSGIRQTTGNEYLNKTLNTLSTNSFGTGIDSDFTDVQISSSDQWLDEWDGQVGYLLIFNREFTAEQHASIAANPWQIFEPERIPVFVPAAASSVVITDVDTDETWDDGDTGLIITGTGFS